MAKVKGLKHRGFESEKYVAPKPEKKEYTHTDLRKAFKKGVITILIIETLILGSVIYFKSHTITETINGVKSITNNVSSIFNQEEV